MVRNAESRLHIVAKTMTLTLRALVDIMIESYELDPELASELVE